MASLTKQGNGYRLQFYGPDRRKRSIWIGNTSIKKAETVKRHVEELIDSRKVGVKPPPETINWVLAVEARIRDLLADYGLLDREVTDTVIASRTSVHSLMESYIADKQHVGDKWRTNFNQAKSWWFKYFDDAQLITQVDDAACVAWHEWMILENKLAPSTAGQHAKRCRQIFKSAVQSRMLSRNPLASVKASSANDSSKNLLVDADDVELIIAQTPDWEWAVLIALVRYGGLRCPSEVFKLKWSHINWEQNKFLVHAPKTTRYGKSKRFFPITPGLKKHLDPLRALVSPGAGTPLDTYVVSRYRSAEKNLRTQLNRFIERAGLPQLPKPFMNMRASARYDFEQSGQFTSDELNEWFGHSESIARKHYGRVGDKSYLKASTLDHGITDGSTGGSIPVDQEVSEEVKDPGKTLEMCEVDTPEVHPIGFEPITLGSEGNSQNDENRCFLKGLSSFHS